VSPGEITERLTGILREVFDDESIVATPQLSAADVEEWDSLNHIRLILTIEREFKLKFAASEVTELKDVGDLIELIKAKTV